MPVKSQDKQYQRKFAERERERGRESKKERIAKAEG